MGEVPTAKQQSEKAASFLVDNENANTTVSPVINRTATLRAPEKVVPHLCKTRQTNFPADILIQLLVFKPLSYCFEETIGFEK